MKLFSNTSHPEPWDDSSNWFSSL